MYNTRSGNRPTVGVSGKVVAALAALLILRQLGGGFGGPAGVVGILLALALCAGAASRWLPIPAAERSRRRRAMILGSGPAAEHLERVAEQEGWELVAFVEFIQRSAAAAWSTEGILPDVVREMRIERVVVVEHPGLAWELVAQIDRDESPVEVLVVPSAYELAVVPHATWLRMGDVALVRLSRGRSRKGQRIAKRALDVTLSVLALLVFGPLLLFTMLLIRLTSSGPALFRQVRVGKDGEEFEILKLRTMVKDAEKDGPRFCAGKRDPRLTCVGAFLRRTHLDELPQIWNVLKGDMSLVGPRPERPVFVARFIDELPRYSERHRIRPGITGLAQVNGFYHSDAREKLRFDLMYLYHQSIWLDASILVRTLVHVFL